MEQDTLIILLYSLGILVNFIIYYIISKRNKEFKESDKSDAFLGFTIFSWLVTITIIIILFIDFIKNKIFNLK